MKKSVEKLFENIDKGVAEYHKAVLAMSNKELYEHVYNDDYNSEDFASKELERRGINKDGCYKCYACQNGCTVCGGSGFIDGL